jgi:hypothetical protein
MISLHLSVGEYSYRIPNFVAVYDQQIHSSSDGASHLQTYSTTKLLIIKADVRTFRTKHLHNQQELGKKDHAYSTITKLDSCLKLDTLTPDLSSS